LPRHAVPCPRIDFGRVFAATFRIWGRTLPRLLPVALLVLLLLFLLDLQLALGRFALEPWARPRFMFFYLVRTPLTPFLGLVLAGLVAPGHVERLRGRSVSLREDARLALRSLPWVVPLSLLVLLALGAMAGALLLPGFLAGTVLTRSNLPSAFRGAIAGVVIGALIAAALGLLLWCRWYAAAPASAVERVGATAAMGRSRDLTAGSRWIVLALVVVLFMIRAVAGTFVNLILGAGMTGGRGMALPAVSIGFLVSTAGALLPAAAMSVVYHELRCLKEALGMEDLARVFE
jgi:hypothetical protein